MAAGARMQCLIVLVMLLVTPTYCRQLAEATEVEQKKNPVQKEFGFSSFSSFSMPTFSSLSFYKPTTVEAKSSLTGLPALMSFQQQMGRGWLGPTVQWPPQSWQSNPSGSQPNEVPAPSQPSPADTSAPTPDPAPAATPAPQQPAASQPTSSDDSACSSTKRSASAVHSCVNAMRTNPRAWTSAYKCDWQSWMAGISQLQRPLLQANSQLGSSAARLAEDMARTRTVSHVGSDGSTMKQRIAATGFDTYPQAENVAGGQGSALEVAADWMCSEGHRGNIMSCSIDSVGTATAYDSNGRAYYVQDFGCSATNSCRC